MAIDLFEDEQRIYNEAVSLIEHVRSGANFDFQEYAILTREYGALLRQLRRSTRIADRTTIDLYESNLNLTDKVHFDVMTGIHNRRFMEDNLKRIIKTLSRSNGELSVMMIDVDFFKKYNDTYGHNAGDDCLKAIANALSDTTTRTDDFVARYGGEEFIVILPNTNENGARIMANKTLKSVESLAIPHEKNDVASHVTISVGVTSGHVMPYQSETDYIKRADEALYVSKQSGRNRYTFLSLEE